MEFGIDAMTTPRRDDTTVPRLCMFFNNATKVSYGRTGLYDLNCLVQAFACRFDHSDRVQVRPGSIAYIIRFVEISVIAFMI